MAVVAATVVLVLVLVLMMPRAVKAAQQTIVVTSWRCCCAQLAIEKDLVHRFEKGEAALLVKVAAASALVAAAAHETKEKATELAKDIKFKEILAKAGHTAEQVAEGAAVK